MLDNLNQRTAWAIKIIAEDHDLDRGITDVDLAKILGTNKNTLAGYRKEEGLLKGEVIENLVLHYHFHPMWLFLNEGEPFPGARAKYKDVCGPEEPPPASYIKEEQAAWTADGAAQKINIDEAWGKTYKVLKSGTPYAVALYLNIQQFSGALDATTELQVCKDSIADLQSQVDALRRQVDGITAPPTSLNQRADSSEKEAM